MRRAHSRPYSLPGTHPQTATSNPPPAADLLQFIGTHWAAQLINLASMYNINGADPIDTESFGVEKALGLFALYQWVALPITFSLALLVHLFVEKPIMLLRS